MDFISKNLLRVAGFLVAAQVFLTLGLTGDDLGAKLAYAGKTALMPIPLLAVGGFLASENGLRAAGFTIMLWAGAGLTIFLGAVYGDPNKDRLPYVEVPDVSQLSLPFGLANFALVLLIGTAVWLSGLKLEPGVGEYHGIGRA